VALPRPRDYPPAFNQRQKPISLLPHPIDRSRGRIPLTRGHGDGDSNSSEKRRLLCRPGYERGVPSSNLSCGRSNTSRERPRCAGLRCGGPRPAPKAAGLFGNGRQWM